MKVHFSQKNKKKILIDRHAEKEREREKETEYAVEFQLKALNFFFAYI